MRPSRNEEAWASLHFLHHPSPSRWSSPLAKSKLKARSATEAPFIVSTRRSSLVDVHSLSSPFTTRRRSTEEAFVTIFCFGSVMLGMSMTRHRLCGSMLEMRNLGPDNNVSDDDMVKLALVLFLEMTLVGKDDRNAVMYWALQLVDDLDEFNSFPWGTFLYGRTFDSLSTCVVGRDDKYKERLESPAKRKAEKYNVYGFVTAFQLTIFKYLVLSDEEIRKPYWASIDQSQIPIDPMIVSPEKFDCGVDDDDFEVDVQEDIDNVDGGAEKIYDDCKDDIQHSNIGYEMKKEVNPTSFKKDQGESKKGWKRLKEMEEIERDGNTIEEDANTAR
ncbi:hypothetical protein Ddye_025607 [Dipteronia dyeriana]|uniref:DUF1985 domain-containing protein n=1 Tax=Dipteronia dyeriana TaxID=168575 RepID=A0AAD9TL68_9ROSI|nr:hypothetical protein Ddye_025607 [Dipteronia dyeriana]